MSQFVIDEQLPFDRVVFPIRRWASAKRIDELRPAEVIKDDRIGTLLQQIKQPTFITIDGGFWNSRYCHPDYCILYFALRDDQHAEIPVLLRKCCQMDLFKTKKARMGKVVKISRSRIEYLERGFTSPKVVSVILK
ncbi:hypothetical protein HUU40_15580 [candidate division KSB1 bacterium]|nr:hypothetical protein [candidate division KSB1 bacterium]